MIFRPLPSGWGQLIARTVCVQDARSSPTVTEGFWVATLMNYIVAVWVGWATDVRSKILTVLFPAPVGPITL